MAQLLHPQARRSLGRSWKSLKEKSAAPAIGVSDEQQQKTDQKAAIVWTVISVVGLALVGLVILLIVKRSRRGRNGNSGLGAPVSYRQYGQQPYPQQNPYQQPVSPQPHNPYQQQPDPPHNQRPPQQ